MALSPTMQIFRNACDQLGAVLTQHGFKYRKSKREAVRRGRRFEHLVTFRTAHWNGLDGSVHLEVWAMARSQRLAEYRRNAGIELPFNEDFLFGIDIENIFRPAPPYIRYDIGDPQRRPAVLTRVTEALEKEVLRAFDLIESPCRFHDALADQPIPGFKDVAIRDFLACYGFAGVDPGWVTPTVQQVAEMVEQTRAFDRLPVLADALEEAGCDNVDILSHLRNDGEHIRGCQVVDLVLGKE